MTERLRQVKEQLDTVAQLESVMTAMRGIAASHLRDAHDQLPGIRAYSNTIGIAIGKALAFLPTVTSEIIHEDVDSSELILVVTAEQGFAGSFNERIMDTVQEYTAHRSTAAILLVGNRGLNVAQERNLTLLDSLSMISRVHAVPKLAMKLADRIYTLISGHDFQRVTLIHPAMNESAELTISIRSLIPFDFSRFAVSTSRVAPVITEEPTVLVNHLAEEYVFAELCDALSLSHAAENEARVRAMVRARSNVASTRTELQAHYQQLRQDQITAEISELTTGRIAGSRSEA